MLKDVIEQTKAEEATGIPENTHGIGAFYDGRGNLLTLEEAKEQFEESKVIEAPNAGAGSYHKVLAALGATKVEVWDHTSSAGDWSFMVELAGTWFCVSQSNRWPKHGFSYCLSKELQAETKEELGRMLESYG